MIKLGDKIRLGIMYGFMALVAYVWIEAILLIQMAYSEQLPPLGFDFKFLNITDGDDETEVPEDRQDLLEEDDSTDGDNETEVPDDIDGLQDEEEE